MDIKEVNTLFPFFVKNSLKGREGSRETWQEGILRILLEE